MDEGKDDRDAKVRAFLEQIRGTFIEDVREAKGRLEQSGAQFDRRVYIRAVFASIEGMVFEFKRVVLTAHEADAAKLTRAELAVLREETYDLADTGDAVARTRYFPLPPTLRFAFRTFARLLGSNYHPPVDGAGWQAFREALEIRNRITHPRSLEDGQVSDQDLTVVGRAYQWYEEALKGLFESLPFRRRSA
jgi:hypothetical protein